MDDLLRPDGAFAATYVRRHLRRVVVAENTDQFGSHSRALAQLTVVVPVCAG